MSNHLGTMFLVICTIHCMAAPSACRGDRELREPIQVSNHPQLFLDDFLVASVHDATRVVMQPERHPANPLLTQDRPWEQRMMSVYGTVLYDAGAKKYRCWYCASESDSGVPDTPEAPGTAEYYQCYAESDDGIAWTKPNVGLRQFGRHRAHNIVAPKTHGLCVLPIRDSHGAGHRYLGLGGATLVVSPDGIQWRELSPGENNWSAAVGKNDTSSCVVRWQGKHLAFVRFQGAERAVSDPKTGLEWRGVMRKIGLCTSTDGVHWTRKSRVFQSDLADGYPWTQPYGISVTPYGDVLIGLLPMLRLEPQAANNSYGSTEVQLVVSRDGQDWRRVADRGVFMSPASVASDHGERPWDMEVYPSTTLLVRNDQVRIYYTGKDVLHGERRLPAKHDLESAHGIGLATLPADRFVALRPTSVATKAVLTTNPLLISGSELLVNADVAADDFSVALLDSRGNVLKGFAAGDSRLVRHDPLRYRVRWITGVTAEHTLGDAPRSNPIAIRFVWQNGDLFAFQIQAR